MPLALTDEQLATIINAAAPLSPDRRDPFLQEVTSALASCAEIGPGTVHRVCAVAQRHFWDPPREAENTWGHAGREKPGRPPRVRA